MTKVQPTSERAAWTPRHLVIVAVAHAIGFVGGAYCGLIAYFYAGRTGFFGVPHTAGQRTLGTIALAAAPVVLAAGPLTAWVVRRTRAWLLIAGTVVLAAAALAVWWGSLVTR